MSVLRPFALLLLGTVLATPSWGRAQSGGPDAIPEDLGHFRVGRLQYAGGGDWYANPSSLPNLLEELEARTGIRTWADDVPVTLDDERLYSYPMLYATGHGTIRPTGADLERLRRYLDSGGFLWVDDNYGLDESFRTMVGELYPDRRLEPLSSRHPIYRAYYDLPGLPKVHEHDGDPAQGYGVFDGQGRLAILYTWSSDIGDGLEDPAVHDNPPQVREAAIQMAVNVCVFALTQP